MVAQWFPTNKNPDITNISCYCTKQQIIIYSGGVLRELILILEKAYPPAINKASLEVEEGRYDFRELEQKVNRVEILNQAMNLRVADEDNKTI